MPRQPRLSAARTTAIVAVCLLAALVLVGRLSSPGRMPQRARPAAPTSTTASTAPAPTLTSPASVPTAPAVAQPPTSKPSWLIPTTRPLADGRVLMPATFPDGTTAEVVYPKHLHLAQLGVRPYGSAELMGCCARDFAFWRGRGSWFAGAGRPIRQLRGSGGQSVTLWPGPPGDDAQRYLVFQFGAWRLAVWDDGTMTDQQLAGWATHLRGRETQDGFLVLVATAPLRLAAAGEHAGPRLEFGEVGGRQLQLTPGRCDKDQIPRVRNEDPVSAVVCRVAWSMSANVTGDRAFAEAVIRGLEIRNVRLA